MKITLYPPLSIHEIGMRQNQEDAIAQWDNRLFVLCDGMGGHEKGEVASQTVSQSLIKWFEEHIHPEEPFTDDQLREALESAYQALDQYADGTVKQMGTTLTLLYLHQSGATAMHMGDSRIYHFRPSWGMMYQSRDHSLRYDLFQAGEINYKEMLNYPQKNIVTRAMTLGEDNRMRPDIIHITDIEPDDWFYLCSDGMLERMDNSSIIAVLNADNLSDKEKMQHLRLATSQHFDNRSAWLVHIKDVEQEEGDDQLVNEEPTARCNALNFIPRIVEGYIDDVVVVKEIAKTKTLLQKMKSVVDIIINKKK